MAHANRDRLAEVAASLGLLAGSLGKMARDISLMSQTEIDEVAEPSGPGRGGSSTMPHKRNPVGFARDSSGRRSFACPRSISTMLTAMVQEHERGLGGAGTPNGKRCRRFSGWWPAPWLT